MFIQKKKERYKITDLNFLHQKIEKEQSKSKVSRIKKIIQIPVKIKEMANKR